MSLTHVPNVILKTSVKHSDDMVRLSIKALPWLKSHVIQAVGDASLSSCGLTFKAEALCSREQVSSPQTRS